MKIINRYGPCWLLTLFKFKRLQIELVYCPPHYEITPHSHDNQDIKLVFLFGHNIRFFRWRSGQGLISFFARSRHIFKVFTINSGDIHYFRVSRWPLIFINIERWKCVPSSASIDFQLAKEKQLISK